MAWRCPTGPCRMLPAGRARCPERCTAAGGIYLRADLTGRGSFYYDLPALDPYTSHAYVLLNLKAGVIRDRWSADVWIRNVTDRDYTVRGFYFGDVPPAFAYQQFAQLGPPRQVGATVSYSLK